MPAYGNVPDEDIAVMRNAARIATHVAGSLPADIPSSWQDTVYETLLSGILNDWVANGTNELDEEDEEDLAQMVRACIDIAREQDNRYRDVAFRILLKGILADWAENWNVE
jgi:hypothetical protein